MNKNLNEVARIETNRVAKKIAIALYESNFEKKTNVVDYDEAYSEAFRIARRILKIRNNEILEEEDSRYEEYYELSQDIFNQAFHRVVRSQFDF